MSVWRRTGRGALWPLAVLWRTVFAEPYREAQAECRAFDRTAEADRFDRDLFVTLLVCALSLSLIHYTTPSALIEWLSALGLHGPAAWLHSELAETEARSLPRLAFWASVSVFGYVLVPVLAIRLLMRRRVVDFGLRVRGIWRHAWIYGLMFAVMLPVVWIMSAEESFAATYPFLRLEEEEPLWPRFWIWQAMYAAQFLALEFFFRGFLVHGLRRRFGYYAVFVMVVPYCMIHFGKPMPETLGAILAGLILGSLSLKTRSIWFGAALHVAVALAMDLSVLARHHS